MHLTSTLLRFELVRDGWGVGVGNGVCVCVCGGGWVGEEARGRVAPEVHLASTLLKLEIVRDGLEGWGRGLRVKRRGVGLQRLLLLLLLFVIFFALIQLGVKHQLTYLLTHHLLRLVTNELDSFSFS